MSEFEIRQGDALSVLRELEAGSVQTCVTSPPYWGLRDYGTAEWEGGDSACDHRPARLKADRNEERQTFGDSWATHPTQLIAFGKRQICDKCGAAKTDSQLGLEPTPEEYVANLVAVMAEVWRVLRDDGTLWLNLGDSYATNRNDHVGGGFGDESIDEHSTIAKRGRHCPPGLKMKDLCGIPWRVAFALQAAGWYLRSDVIWAKPNPMPESVTDRPTRSHEYLFLLTKSARYFYDADAIREADSGLASGNGFNGRQGGSERYGEALDGGAGTEERWTAGGGRNKRSVWTVTTQPYAEAHFATFPPKLIEPAILAGSPPKCCGECGAPYERIVEISRELEEGRRELGLGYKTTEIGPVPGVTTLHHDIERETKGWRATCEHDDDSGAALVLDPFNGAGTTGLVALRHDRDFLGIELNPEYVEMARRRLKRDAPLSNADVGADPPEPRDGEQLAFG